MERRSVPLASGVSYSVLEGGSGRPLIMLPGWSQSAAQYRWQFNDFSRIARVIAVDLRGHGESESPDHGYRIQRLAKDLYELLTALDIDDFDLLGHSMGCSVLWSYLSLYDHARSPRRIVIVDQAPAVTAHVGWSVAQLADAGCLFKDFSSMFDFLDAVRSATDPIAHKELIRGMFTPGIAEEKLDWVTEENLKMARGHAADLLYDHCVLDWRTEIQRISQPTLVIGAEASIFSAQSQAWIAAQIPGAELEVFEADAGGSHFMFIENPDRFNARVVSFLRP